MDITATGWNESIVVSRVSIETWSDWLARADITKLVIANHFDRYRSSEGNPLVLMYLDDVVNVMD